MFRDSFTSDACVRGSDGDAGEHVSFPDSTSNPQHPASRERPCTCIYVAGRVAPPSSFSVCLHVLAPRYLTDDIRHVADINRRCLRSSSSALLSVRSTRLVTMGDRAFPVAGSRLWNSLPHNITSAPTLPVFCTCLKTYLFQRSFSS